MTRFITVWRKPDDVFEFGQHFSETGEELKQAFANLLNQGVRDFVTYKLGDKVDEFSKGFL